MVTIRSGDRIVGFHEWRRGRHQGVHDPAQLAGMVRLRLRVLRRHDQPPRVPRRIVNIEGDFYRLQDRRRLTTRRLETN